MGKLRGIAKAKKINARRSKQAKSSDNARAAKKIYRPTNAGIKKWRKNPARSDIRHVDTKRRKT